MTCCYPVLPMYRDNFNRSGLRVVEWPTEEPIPLAVAKQHLRLDDYGEGSPEAHPDDAMIQEYYLPAAREYCESLSGRALARMTVEYILDAFPRVSVAYGRPGIRLPYGPTMAINSVYYTDGDGLQQAISDYQYDLYTDNGYIYPYPGSSWPTTQSDLVNGVVVQYVVGYDADNASPLAFKMPRRYKQAILLMLGHFYENRLEIEEMDKVPRQLALGVGALLLPDRLRLGFA